MILYCDYCRTVFGADVTHAPTRAFCSSECERDFGSGPTLPPESDAELNDDERLQSIQDEERQRGEDAAEYALDAECFDAT